MAKKIPLLLLAIGITIIIASTVYPLAVVVVDNTPPVVDVAVPANGQTYTPSSITQLSVNCWDPESGIRSVTTIIDSVSYNLAWVSTSSQTTSSVNTIWDPSVEQYDPTKPIGYLTNPYAWNGQVDPGNPGSVNMSTVAHSGVYSLMMTSYPNATEPGQHHGANWWQYHTNGDMLPGHTYEIRAWIQTYQCKLVVGVGMWDSQGNWLAGVEKGWTNGSQWSIYSSPDQNTWYQTPWIPFTVPVGVPSYVIAPVTGVRLDEIDTSATQSNPAWARTDDWECYELLPPRELWQSAVLSTPLTVTSHWFTTTVTNNASLITTVSGTFNIYNGLLGDWYINDILVTSASQTIYSTSLAVNFKFVKRLGMADASTNCYVLEGNNQLIQLTNSAPSTWTGTYTFTGGTHTLTAKAVDSQTNVIMSIFTVNLPGGPPGPISTQIILWIIGAVFVALSGITALVKRDIK